MNKKILIYLTAISLFLISCADNSNDINTEKSTAQTNHYKVRGDNKYDVLGFGFDATGEYLDQMKTAYQVIDVQKLQDSTGLVISDDPIHSELDIKSGSDAKSFLQKFSTKFSVEGAIPINGIPFTGSLNAEFGSSKTISSKYSYAMADLKVYVSHHSINKNTPISTLKRYLTKQFLSDINTLTPAQIIASYGTHVYTDIYTGGKMSFQYKAYVNSTTKETSASYGAKMGVNAATNTNLSVSNTTNYTTTSSSSFQQEFMSYKTVGGTSASPMGTWTPNSGSSAPINFNQWSSTISKNTPYSLQLIDVGESSLKAIYEFVEDPIKKENLKNAVNQYILGKAFNVVPVKPLYRYCSNLNNHFYTTNWNEFGVGNDSWKYEGIAAFICEKQEENTVPLYRFFKKTKKFLGHTYLDHYYTCDFNSGINNGYPYEGIEGYVYTSPLNNTVGLRQYYRSAIYDHFYTTDINELGNGSMGWNYNCDACYVFPGTR